MLALSLAFVLLAIAAACSGDGDNPDRLLQLTIGSFTEDQYRSLFQEVIAEQEEYEIVCAALSRLSNDEAVEPIVVSKSSRVPPGPEVVVADEKRSIQILREECEAAGLG